MEICVDSTEENLQAPWSIGSMSFPWLNEKDLCEMDMIERYVNKWQPAQEPVRETSQGSVGASSVTENSDVTSQGTEAREGEVEDFCAVDATRQHPSLLLGGVADMDDDGDEDSLVSSPTRTHNPLKETATQLRRILKVFPYSFKY